MNLIDLVNADHANPNVAKFPEFQTGDTLEVGVKIKEGDKSRIQLFQGICIAMKNQGHINGHFRIRKMSDGVGVERVFPFHSPNVETIKIIARGKSKRAKFFYLRERTGKSAKVAVDYSKSI